MTTTTTPRGVLVAPAGLDVDAAYQALAARDRRFDGRVWFGVTSTGVYCRPVCPAQTPKPANVRFFASPAAAVSSGFRACRRCRPDSAPGSRHWDHRGDLAARALRLIADGAVDDGGVAGLARSLHVSERHLHRTLIAEVGAGPLHLAMSRRAQTARLLIEQTTLPLADVAFAAGFSSVRQFNDVMRREFGAARRRSCAGRRSPRSPRPIRLSCCVCGCVRRTTRTPSASSSRRARSTGSRCTRRRLAAGRSDGSCRCDRGRRSSASRSRATTSSCAATPTCATRRRWSVGYAGGSTSTPSRATIDAALSADPVLAPLVAARPGLRVPTTVDPWETVVRAIVGQQVSVAGARTLLGRIVRDLGTDRVGGAARAFPTAGALAEAGPDRHRGDRHAGCVERVPCTP